MSLSAEQVETFNRDGFLIVENFFTAAECDALREKAHLIVSEADFSQHPTVTFTTMDQNAQQCRSQYFITSGDKIRFFFEEGAMGEDGRLKLDPTLALNKMGHALHVLDPDFKKATFCDKIKDIARSLDLKKPCVPQSMVIFKPPRVGGVVNPHQDSSFLYTTPMKLVGFWIALEDADLENGCMWFAPGTHKNGISGRLVRTVKDGVLATSFEGSVTSCTKPEEFVAKPTRKGTLVLIHGEVVHKSGTNLSDRSRNIYTFHLYDAGVSEWSKDNWQQPTEEVPFPFLY